MYVIAALPVFAFRLSRAAAVMCGTFLELYVDVVLPVFAIRLSRATTFMCDAFSIGCRWRAATCEPPPDPALWRPGNGFLLEPVTGTCARHVGCCRSLRELRRAARRALSRTSHREGNRASLAPGRKEPS